MRIAVMGSRRRRRLLRREARAGGPRRHVHRARPASRRDARARPRGRERARRHARSRRRKRHRRSGVARRRSTSCCSASSCGTPRARRRRSRRCVATGGVVDSVPERRREHRACSARRSARQRVMGGVAYIAATIARAGRHRAHRHDGAAALRRGSPAQQPSGARRLLAACQRAGIDAELSADIRRALWEKFVLPGGAVGHARRVARQPLGVHPRRSRSARDVRGGDARGVDASAARSGVALADDFVARQMAFARRAAGGDDARRCRTISTAGNRLEAPWLSGAVARDGEATRASRRPSTRRSYAALKPYCRRRAR